MGSGGGPEAERSPAGLCNLCRHQRLVPNTRGSVFSLCERSRHDRRFARYPRLPVLDCLGFEPATQDGTSGTSSSSPSDPAPPAG